MTGEASTEAKPAAVCPVCKVRMLRYHCDSSTCPWWRCRNKACEAVLDLAARRGFKPSKSKLGVFDPVTL